MSEFNMEKDIALADTYSGWIKGREDGIAQERERIIKNIQSRISDLRACGKRDNCKELARLIESYIPEWTEGEQK